MIELIKGVWGKALRQGTKLRLMGDPAKFQLMVDYGSKGFGYAPFAGSHKHGKLIGINSKRSIAKFVSSYLGELQATYWALNKTRNLVQGRNLVLWTDYESAFRRIKNCQYRHNPCLQLKWFTLG